MRLTLLKVERIYHTWDKWECYPSGFYEEKPPKGMSNEQCEEAYRDFLSNYAEFSAGLYRVITEWKNSCEHYLTNESMNRIAWLGQAAMCISTGIPSRYRGGYNLLSDEDKEKADKLALTYLNLWLNNNGYEAADAVKAGKNALVNLY